MENKRGSWLRVRPEHNRLEAVADGEERGWANYIFFQPPYQPHPAWELGERMMKLLAWINEGESTEERRGLVIIVEEDQTTKEG